jgi:hypothetical protein
MCAFVFHAKAQVSEGTKIGIATGRGLNAPRSDVFWTSPTDVSNVIGDFYIDSLWQEGNVKFTTIIPQLGGLDSDSLSGIVIRYNVLNNELEVLVDKAKNDIRVIRSNQLKKFTVENGAGVETYVNAAIFKSEKPLSGFASVLATGKLMLIKYYYPKITKPNYNPGFNTGEKNTIVRVTSDYYIVLNNNAEKLNTSKKSILALMKDRGAEVENYIKEYNVNFKNEADLAGLFGFYNSK